MIKLIRSNWAKQHETHHRNLMNQQKNVRRREKTMRIDQQKKSHEKTKRKYIWWERMLSFKYVWNVTRISSGLYFGYFAMLWSLVECRQPSILLVHLLVVAVGFFFSSADAKCALKPRLIYCHSDRQRCVTSFMRLH